MVPVELGRVGVCFHVGRCPVYLEGMAPVLGRHGKVELDKTVELIKIHTRRFAKSQRTWFKSFHDANTIELPADATVDTTVERIGAVSA